MGFNPSDNHSLDPFSSDSEEEQDGAESGMDSSYYSVASLDIEYFDFRH